MLKHFYGEERLSLFVEILLFWEISHERKLASYSSLSFLISPWLAGKKGKASCRSKKGENPLGLIEIAGLAKKRERGVSRSIRQSTTTGERGVGVKRRRRKVKVAGFPLSFSRMYSHGSRKLRERKKASETSDLFFHD